jgi:hypothetical protein
MIGTYARRLRATDYPWAPTREQREEFLKRSRRSMGRTGRHRRTRAQRRRRPGVPRLVGVVPAHGRSPAAAVALTRMNAEIDVRASCRPFVCPHWCCIVPATVPARRGRPLRGGLIPGAQFVELPGDDHLPFVGDQGALLDEIERFLSTRRGQVDEDRVLVTVVCVQPATGARTKDSAALDRLQHIAAEQAPLFGGRGVRIAGDRVIVTFDGPARAIRCACAMRDGAADARLDAQFGLHTGESELVDGVPCGVVVDVGGRVAGLASPAEILVTRTVVDLVAGSGLRFADRGPQTLGENLEDWHVYAVC